MNRAKINFGSLRNFTNRAKIKAVISTLEITAFTNYY
jgi:hypothetical protein